MGRHATDRWIHDWPAGAITRRRVALLALPSAVLAGMLPAAGRAQAETWLVTGIAVDVAGPDAVAARDQALADGTRQAWEQLLARITSPERAAALRALAPAEIEALTESVEIDDERVAPNRYRATLNVKFSPRRVRTRMAESGATGGGPVTATASFRGIGQWADLQRRLEASPAIARVELRALRVAEAELQLLLTQDPAAAAEALLASGVRLVPDAAGGPFRVSLAAP